MMDQIPAGWAGALIAGTSLIAVQLLKSAYARWAKSAKSGGAVAVAEISGATKLIDQMDEQITRLWARSREQDDEIRKLHAEVNNCEGRHTLLQYEHDELKRRYEDLERRLLGHEEREQ